MNPLPNRPLLNNPSAPLSLPNVPSFDQIAYNSRPRKVLPEGKEFPTLNGMNTISGPQSSGMPNGGPQMSILERNPHPNAGMVTQPSPLSQLTPQNAGQNQEAPPHSQTDKNGEAESENRQLTAIFRPDDAGEWKEKLRLSHEAAEKAKMAREFSQATATGSGSWDRQHEEEEDVKEEEGEVEDEESTLIGDGEGGKLWKAKRTLRKLVLSS